MTRWIDDIFGCWVRDQCKSMKCSHWKDFVNSTPFGTFTWTIGKQVVFLDMTVSIENGRITTSSNQKPMNLYLYLLLTKYKSNNTN